ncbi:MAG: VCBS repeat-containing protein, partial [candidate division Zixibacteria bacterium]|nr:VCBS repeat-containing protein [candidate division Zixibacteria bacterium]
MAPPANPHNPKPLDHSLFCAILTLKEYSHTTSKEITNMKSLTLFRNCILVALLVTLSSISAFSQDMFAPPVNYATGDAPFPVFSIDFNSDGNNDLVTANTDSHNVTILLGNGDGTFQGAVNYAVGYSPISVFSIDFNGDGDNDLASANRSSDNVSILLGNGDGTFQSAV